MELKERKVKIIYMILIGMILLLPLKAKAYTTGTAYGKLNFTNNFWNEYVACGYTGYCSKNIAISTNQRPTITCDTNQCFISFTSFATLQQTSPTQTISYFVQVKETNGTWLPCETTGGTSTCMIPKNTTLTDIEVKFMQYSNTLNVNIDMNTILIFNSPSDTEQQLNNIQQQQQNNWNNFENQNISQQDQTPPDYTEITQTQGQETQQINSLFTILNGIEAPRFTLDDFTGTFAWIWQTIIYIFTTQPVLMSAMLTILSLGFVKQIFGK